LCPRTPDATRHRGGRGEGLGHRGGAKRRAGGWSSDPVIEADVPSTEVLQVQILAWCARPTGAVMISPPTTQRNASRAQSERTRQGGAPEKRGPGQSQGSIKAGARKPRLDKRRATGRIEHTLLVGGWRHLNRPKTFAHNPPANPPYHKKLQMFPFTTKGRSPVA
jgi:hypothetical protein